MKKFWMVWKTTGGNPSYQHDTELSARQEAERLAKMFREDTFVVLESVAEVKVTNVFWNEHGNVDEQVPF